MPTMTMSILISPTLRSAISSLQISITASSLRSNVFEFQAPYLEFPILSGGEVYTGSSPGADRVVIGSIAEDYSSATYCAVITHDGQKKNGFAECKDDTLNVRGKGNDVAHHGHHQHRKLLQKIEL